MNAVRLLHIESGFVNPLAQNSEISMIQRAGEKLLATLDIMSTIDELHAGHFDLTLDILYLISLMDNIFRPCFFLVYLQKTINTVCTAQN
jgi:hypothetical protein